MGHALQLYFCHGISRLRENARVLGLDKNLRNAPRMADCWPRFAPRFWALTWVIRYCMQEMNPRNVPPYHMD